MRMMGKSGHARDGKFVGERYYVLSNASRTTAIAGGSRLASATIFVLSLLTSGNDCGIAKCTGNRSVRPLTARRLPAGPAPTSARP